MRGAAAGRGAPPARCPRRRRRSNDEDAVTAPDSRDPREARKLSLDIFHEVTAHVDGAALVRAAARGEAAAAATHVLAVGKVAFPMLMGAGADHPGSTPR